MPFSCRYLIVVVWSAARALFLVVCAKAILWPLYSVPSLPISAQNFTSVTPSIALAIIGILIITSKGAAGVTGSGFIVLASTLAAIKVIPVEGLALLLGVDRFMSEARAITNLVGNTVATVVIAKSENSVDLVTYKAVVEGQPVTLPVINPGFEERQEEL